MMNTTKTAVFAIFLALAASLAACSKPQEKKEPAPKAASSPSPSQEPAAEKTALDYVAAKEIYNKEAPIPPQCYTKTEGAHNPCYVCHQTYQDKRPNRMNDGFQQGRYVFSEYGEDNSWTNLFKDRTAEIEKISDAQIRKYVDEDNYTLLLELLRSEHWRGANFELEDLHKGAEAFEPNGLAKDGSRWVAFNYKPFPSTFWPTNGSTDDTMIRLAPAFSERDGSFSEDVYFTNLAIAEMAITSLQEITVVPIDENKVGSDLDGDGALKAGVEKILWQEKYVGDASDTQVFEMLYPEGTEFLHTVRYLGVADDGSIYLPQRMKEVRYMKKAKFREAKSLAVTYYSEFKEKEKEKLPKLLDHGQDGISNAMGWQIVAFIENEKGILRKEHPEELFACAGCHKSIGSTIDHTFAFPRKVRGAAGWGYIDLSKQTDVPSRGEKEGEFLTYMRRVGGGDEFRQNQEMLSRWFNEDGQVDEKKVKGVKSLAELILPSDKRALLLNKAYQVVVKEQSFLFGRDAVVKPASNVLQEVDTTQAPLPPDKTFQYDMRLAYDAP